MQDGYLFKRLNEEFFQFELNETSPPVINLQLQLPNKQAVYYWKNQNLQNVLY